ncbi:hypothetical protein MHYP_G00335260 [Metynnis hypsauchen]
MIRRHYCTFNLLLRLTPSLILERSLITFVVLWCYRGFLQTVSFPAVRDCRLPASAQKEFGRRAGILVRLKRLVGDPTIPAEAEGLERYHIAPRSWDDHLWAFDLHICVSSPPLCHSCFQDSNNHQHH